MMSFWSNQADPTHAEDVYSHITSKVWHFLAKTIPSMSTGLHEPGLVFFKMLSLYSRSLCIWQTWTDHIILGSSCLARAPIWWPSCTIASLYLYWKGAVNKEKASGAGPCCSLCGDAFLQNPQDFWGVSSNHTVMLHVGACFPLKKKMWYSFHPSPPE